ncbi:MAG: sugar transferase [Lachnospiraceae bacterium]|nr:sugar transferase [Lachnospiraceae bacterium]
MNPRIRIIQTYGLWLLDMLCIVASYMIATSMRYMGNDDWGDRTLHYMVCVLFLLFCTVTNFFVDWNRDFMRRGNFKELMSIIRFNALMIPVSLAFVFFLKWAYILSRSVIINFTWINMLMMLVTHLIFKRLMMKVVTTDSLMSRFIVIASRDVMNSTLVSLLTREDLNINVVGVVYSDSAPEERQSDDREPVMMAGIPVFSGLDRLTSRLTTLSFDEVLINTPDDTVMDMKDVIAGFEEMGVVCHYSLLLPDVGEAITQVGSIGEHTVISFTRFRSSYKRLMVKRLFDIIGGVVGLLFTAAATIFIAPAIKLDSKGPVFFSQIRVGRNGRRFRIYKFRSMYEDAEERKKQLEGMNELDGPMFKIENDPRITRVGAFLRKTSLDEFPQFWNVLKGDMSLVGTRPPTEEEFERYDEHYRRRLSMTPGLTGLWQISGRSDIVSFDDVVKLDLQYIDNWSLSLDFKILLQTVGVVLFGKGAK